MSAETPARPRLKLSVSSTRSFTDGALVQTPSVATPSAATPSGENAIKIKLKIPKGSQPPTPAEGAVPQSATTKAGRQTKPSAKLMESKKREQEELDDTETTKEHARPAKKVKILPTKPGMTRTGSIINIKAKGKPPYHPPGDGYDSEASDREDDPIIEEQIILRMMPGEHADYVRQCIKEHKIGQPRHLGGADITLRFFEEDSRKAVVTVKGQPYAAVLLDLPTITETMKTWDKKALMKSADICQMLLVYQKVKSDDEARKALNPQAVEAGFRWPHGLTPPMHDCVHRRFAKTISRKEIEDKEAEVDRLLAADRGASNTKWEWVDDRRQKSPDESMDEDQDAEGEMDDSGYFPTQGQDSMMAEDDFDLEAQLEAELEEAGMVADFADVNTPATQTDGVTPATREGSTSAVNGKDGRDEEDLFGEAEDDDDDDDADDVDEDEQARLDEITGVKEDIAELRKELKTLEARLQNEPSPLVRKRIEDRVRSLKREVQLKLTSIGEGDEEEE